MCPELRLLWHHRNNLTVDDNGIIWRRRSTQSPLLQLLVPKPGRKELFLSYHASLFGAIRAEIGLWPGWPIVSFGPGCLMLKNGSASVSCASRGSHRLDDIIRWEIFRPAIAGIALRWTSWTSVTRHRTGIATFYFSKWTEAFPIKNKCADTVADILVEKIILRFGMPLVIHSDQGREIENGLMKSLCSLLGCTKTAPYHPESDGMIKRFNQTCLMMLPMFIND